MSHLHPVDPVAVGDAQRTAMPRGEAELIADRLGLLCDPTRLRALVALKQVRALCVGDLALVLDVNEDAASYAVRRLRTAGFVEATRVGRVVFYKLSERFPAILLGDCLAQLQMMSSGGAGETSDVPEDER